MSSLKKAVLAKLRTVRSRDGGGEGKRAHRASLRRGVRPPRPSNRDPVQGKIAHITALFLREETLFHELFFLWRVDRNGDRRGKKLLAEVT